VARWLRIRPWLWIAAGLTILYGIQNLPLGQRITLFISPLVEAMEAPSRWWMEFNLLLEDRQHLQSSIMQLRKAVQHQAGMQEDIRVLRSENLRLRELLGLKGLPGYRWQAARVLGRSPDKTSRRLILRTSAAAQANDVVASGRGLVGLVDTVRGKRAVVRTILDASMAVPVTLPDRKLAALIRGQGESLQVEFVPWKLTPKTGSILVTSGAGGVFPPGIPVAHIVRSRKVPGSVFANIEAVPVAHWRSDAWLSVASRRKP